MYGEADRAQAASCYRRRCCGGASANERSESAQGASSAIRMPRRRRHRTGWAACCGSGRWAGVPGVGATQPGPAADGSDMPLRSGLWPILDDQTGDLSNIPRVASDQDSTNGQHNGRDAPSWALTRRFCCRRPPERPS